MCGHKSRSSFCLFALSLLLIILSAGKQAIAQEPQSFVAFINKVERKGDVYTVDHFVDPAAWEKNSIDHINVRVYPVLNTTIETWSQTNIKQGEEIAIPADTFPDSNQLYDIYRLEMALIKGDQIALSSTGQEYLLIHQFIHHASSQSTSTTINPVDTNNNNDTNDTAVEISETDEITQVEVVSTDASDSESAAPASCNTICEFQKRLDDQPALRYLLFGALGLLLLSLVGVVVQAIRGRKPAQPTPRLRQSPVYSNTVIYTEQEAVGYDPHDDPAGSTGNAQPPTTEFAEHDPLDDIYNNTPDFDPSNPATEYEPFDSVRDHALPIQQSPPIPTYEPQPIAPTHVQSAYAQLEIIGARDVTLIGNRVDVRSFPFTIGRESADLVVDDGRISRNHARLTFDGTSFHVTDLQSSNGVYVEGQKITSNSLMPLSTNKAVKISLGSQLHFVFWGYV